MEFEWDPDKNEANIEKHGIDFERAKEIFAGFVLKKRSDREGERRWLAIGPLEGEIAAVAYTMRGERYRLISARRASRHERREYRQEIAG